MVWEEGSREASPYPDWFIGCGLARRTVVVPRKHHLAKSDRTLSRSPIGEASNRPRENYAPSGNTPMFRPTRSSLEKGRFWDQKAMQ